MHRTAGSIAHCIKCGQAGSILKAAGLREQRRRFTAPPSLPDWKAHSLTKQEGLCGMNQLSLFRKTLRGGRRMRCPAGKPMTLQQPMLYNTIAHSSNQNLTERRLAQSCARRSFKTSRPKKVVLCTIATHLVYMGTSGKCQEGASGSHATDGVLQIIAAL